MHLTLSLYHVLVALITVVYYFLVFQCFFRTDDGFVAAQCFSQ